MDCCLAFQRHWIKSRPCTRISVHNFAFRHWVDYSPPKTHFLLICLVCTLAFPNLWQCSFAHPTFANASNGVQSAMKVNFLALDDPLPKKSTSAWSFTHTSSLSRRGQMVTNWRVRETFNCRPLHWRAFGVERIQLQRLIYSRSWMLTKIDMCAWWQSKRGTRRCTLWRQWVHWTSRPAHPLELLPHKPRIPNLLKMHLVAAEQIQNPS